jgi:hypothetical protein
MPAYVVTLEYDTTNYLRVVVEGNNIREAIDAAYQTDEWELQDSYDEPGDTYVGGIRAFDTVAEAEEHRDEWAEPDGRNIPLQDRSAEYKLQAAQEVASAMLAALKDAHISMQSVVDNWESGDLAGAVNCLPIDDVEAAIAQAEAAGVIPKED